MRRALFSAFVFVALLIASVWGLTGVSPQREVRVMTSLSTRPEPRKMYDITPVTTLPQVVETTTTTEPEPVKQQAPQQVQVQPVQVVQPAPVQVALVEPAPVVYGDTCAGTGVEATIRRAFAGTGDEDYMLHVAWRESRCNPCAFYPSQSDCNADPTTAKGLFGLLNHDDLIEIASPGIPHGWANPGTNSLAARMLYDRGGRGPWN